MAVICWEVWNKRNQFIWNKKKLEDAFVLFSARQSIEQRRQIHGRSTTPKEHLMESSLTKWTAPSPGYTKCNFDGALFEEIGPIGMSFIICDYQVRFLAVKAGSG